MTVRLQAQFMNITGRSQAAAKRHTQRLNAFSKVTAYSVDELFNAWKLWRSIDGRPLSLRWIIEHAGSQGVSPDLFAQHLRSIFAVTERAKSQLHTPNQKAETT